MSRLSRLSLCLWAARPGTRGAGLHLTVRLLGCRDSRLRPVGGSGSVLNVSQGDPLTQGLIAYYPFDGNASDMSGQGHHGTVHGAPLTKDRYGTDSKAYNFDGGGQQYINMGPVLFPENAFTVSIWANFKPGNNKYAHLIENGTLEKNFSGAFRLEHTPTEGEIYFALGDGSTMVENKNNGQHKNTGWKWNRWNL